ncbi:MAG: RNA polymerase factor sigma-54 [Prevotella sp.]|nr:RNA polymerase factor sigma-54 [Prevotella sp.]
MAQIQIQEQKQEQRQLQAISAQQLLVSQLVELPLQQMAERIETELHDNPALEKKASGEEPATDWASPAADGEQDAAEDYDAQREREERSDALDAALQNIGRDDEDLPVYQGGQTWDDNQQEQTEFGQERSFYDLLMEQVGETELTERDRYVLEYIIQSLDDDGLLRTPLADICEQLAIYHHIDISTSEAMVLLKRLQQFDPPGIGARTLKECLLLQIERRKDSPLKQQMLRVVNSYFNEFTKKHWGRIQQQLQLSDSQMDILLTELRRLNPKPGAAMGETVGRSLQQITPDFIVETQEDGTISMSLNSGEMPTLEISQSFADLMKELQTDNENLSRQQKEALLYTKQKIDAAQNFIDAVEQRRRTLTKTMKAIIQMQKPFFEEGDEELLRPMILKDVAQQTGLDLSTISRVSNSKYVQTRWGTFPLKFFFSDSYVTQNGEELSTRKIKATLRNIIENEDKQKPLSDDALRDALAQQGFPIARRTVAKYREQLGLPVARLRKS